MFDVSSPAGLDMYKYICKGLDFILGRVGVSVCVGILKMCGNGILKKVCV